MLEAISSISSSIEHIGGASGSNLNSIQRTTTLGPSQSHASFGDVMVQVAAKATETLKTGEAAAISGIQGKASVQQVVEAVMSAEQALQTAIAIRDKVVAAYQEVSRMAI